MSKTKTATNTATDTKKEKAKAGSSIPTQAKTLVVAIGLELKEGLEALTKSLDLDRLLEFTDVLSEGTAEWLTNLSTEIQSNAQRGLPLSVRLANVEAEITVHWQALPIVNNAAAPTPEWQEKANSLMIKKANLIRAQKRTDNAQTDEAGTSATA